jgi:mannose-6-phosphate isomerase-like protein (cupin superfamily)
MACYIEVKDVKPIKCGEVLTYRLLSQEHGCVKGCCSGINFIMGNEYNEAGVHDDQEGFLIIEGSGWLKVGTEEIRLNPDMSIIVPAGVAHCMKKDPDVKQLKVFWFHAAV